MKTHLPSILIASAAFSLLLASCVGGTRKAPVAPSVGSGADQAAASAIDPTAHRYASYDALAALVDGTDATPFLLLDVRTPEEFAEGHIPGAVLLPYDQIGPGKPDSPKDTLIVVYCRSGRRSAIAAEALGRLGFADIADFGGVSNWRGELAK